jgi:hypothetical protein
MGADEPDPHDHRTLVWGTRLAELSRVFEMIAEEYRAAD